jgi:hypothetical protein
MNSKPLFDTKSIPAPENILATTAPHYSDIIAGPVFLLFARILTFFSLQKWLTKNARHFYSNHSEIMKRNV